jgi:hypothetical protein
MRFHRNAKPTMGGGWLRLRVKTDMYLCAGIAERCEGGTIFLGCTLDLLDSELGAIPYSSISKRI